MHSIVNKLKLIPIVQANDLTTKGHLSLWNVFGLPDGL
jgi:hypothetical protein